MKKVESNRMIQSPFRIPTTRGEMLSTTLLTKEKSAELQPAIFVIHGLGSSQSRYVDRFAPMAEMGYVVLIFDLRGHGKSDGELKNYSISDHLDDCLAAYDFLVSQPNIDREKIFVFGSSYGGHFASVLSSLRPVQGLVFKAPAMYPDTILDSANLIQESPPVTEYWNTLKSFEDNSTLRAAHDFSGEVLFLECEFDDEVPRTCTASFMEAFSVPYDYEMMKGCDHSGKLPGANQVLINTLIKWFKKKI